MIDTIIEEMAAEIERLQRECFTKGAEIQALQDGRANLQRELAEARVIIRKANGSVRHFEDGAYLVRLYHDDFEQMAQFLTAHGLPRETCTCSQPGWATWDAPCPVHSENAR
jgi:hypothetical protein